MATPLTPEEEEKYAGYTPLTGEQFIEVMETGRCEGYEAYLDSNEEAITVCNILTTTKIQIHDAHIFPRNINVTNVVFRENISIAGGIFQGDFWITSGEFQNLMILNGTFEGTLRISGGQFHKELMISEATFRSNFWISSGIFRADVSISGGNFHKDVWISGGQFDNNFSIPLGLFNARFLITGGQFNTNFSISEGIFKDHFSIDGGIFKGNFSIFKGQFDNDFEIFSGLFKNNFQVIEGNFQKDFRIEGGLFSSNFIIEGGDFRREFGVLGGNFCCDFLLYGGFFKKEFWITGGKFNKLSINGGEFTKGISLLGRLNNQEHTIEIKEFYINLDHPKLTINITNISVNTLFVKNVFDLRVLRIVDVDLTTITQNIIIENSTLTNTELVGCDWERATLQVDNSNLMGIFYTDTIFPKNITSSEKFSKKNLEQVRDTYSQLKTVSEKQNDRESSLYFQSRANDQIYKLKIQQMIIVHPPKPLGLLLWILNYKILGISQDFRWSPKWSAIFSGKTAEIIQLWLNKYSNDFGLSYLRAFVMLVICTLVLFCLYVPSVAPEIVWTWNIADIHQGIADGFRLYGDKYFYFINPIRKTGFLCPDVNCTDAHWLAAPVDWFSRIVIFYLSYQFVQAFRKYGRV